MGRCKGGGNGIGTGDKDFDVPDADMSCSPHEPFPVTMVMG